MNKTGLLNQHRTLDIRGNGDRRPKRTAPYKQKDDATAARTGLTSNEDTHGGCQSANGGEAARPGTVPAEVLDAVFEVILIFRRLQLLCECMCGMLSVF